MASTFKLAVDKMGATDPYNYIGRKGDVFYDPEFGELRISDGDTPYGLGLQAGIGASTPTINQVLTVDNVASLEALFAGGIRFESVESLEGLQPITFDADVIIADGRTLTANTTSFGTLNGLTIPNSPGTIALLSNIAGSGTVLESVQQDTAPRLGGDLDLDQYKITNTSAGAQGIRIQQFGAANPGLIVNNSAGNPILSTTDDVITLKENAWPTTDGAERQILATNGSGQLSWQYRNPSTKFYFHYITTPGTAVLGSDTLGVGVGAWQEVTFANAGGNGNISDHAPSSADFDPTLSGVSANPTTGVFSGFIKGTYDLNIEVRSYNATSSAIMRTYEIASGTTTAQSTVYYPGQAVSNYNDPLVINIRGLFTFEDSIASNNVLQINLPSEQSFGFYIIEAILTVIKIS